MLPEICVDKMLLFVAIMLAFALNFRLINTSLSGLTVTCVMFMSSAFMPVDSASKKIMKRFGSDFELNVRMKIEVMTLELRII